MRRKLGDNDPGRYEISFLVGPCTEAEATQLLEDLFDASDGRLGAVGSLTTWDEDRMTSGRAFAIGSRVTVTYGKWGEDGDVGEIFAADEHGFDWWVKFDGLTLPARFYENELLSAVVPESSDGR